MCLFGGNWYQIVSLCYFRGWGRFFHISETQNNKERRSESFFFKVPLSLLDEPQCTGTVRMFTWVGNKHVTFSSVKAHHRLYLSRVTSPYTSWGVCCRRPDMFCCCQSLSESQRHILLSKTDQETVIDERYPPSRNAHVCFQSEYLVFLDSRADTTLVDSHSSSRRTAAVSVTSSTRLGGVPLQTPSEPHILKQLILWHCWVPQGLRQHGTRMTAQEWELKSR